jgi:glycosyltransferase involved in cell wall biosynthesis
MLTDRRVRNVCIVGPGDRFKSGLSQYTFRLAKAFDEHHHVSVLLLRRLVPRRLYPGAARVGTNLGESLWPTRIRRFDGIDWYWGRSLASAMAFLRRDAPDVIVLQWWTGAVLHTYIALCGWARVRHVPVVMEFHEVLDPGEAENTIASFYSRRLIRVLLRQLAGAIVHSESDLVQLRKAYHLDRIPIAVARHGPYDHLASAHATVRQTSAGIRPDGPGDLKLLFFGLLRPYKGLDTFLRAFNEIPTAELGETVLTIVGETWEHHDEPAQLIKQSPHRGRITFVNRYVSDDEIPLIYADADALILPYRRLSSSGPMSIATSIGLPVLVSEIPEMREALHDYAGAVYCNFESGIELISALSELKALKGRRFSSTRSWDDTVRVYEDLFSALAD